jgi:hypothetical protein
MFFLSKKYAALLLYLTAIKSSLLKISLFASRAHMSCATSDDVSIYDITTIRYATSDEISIYDVTIIYYETILKGNLR